MYEGYSDYDEFVASLSDGFTNALNDRLPEGSELLCNVDGLSVLYAAFDKPMTANALRTVTLEQITKLQADLAQGCDLSMSADDVRDCLQQALRQSIGDDADQE